MNDLNDLGDYLKARREQVQPEDVGIRVGGLRRVAGLRREEVAMLAGISSDYYLRLEQGRDRNPSLQVLEALARVLQLDAPAAAYLVSLAAPRTPRTPQSPRHEVVPEGILKLLDTLDLPAFVEGRYFDVLASNALAVALSPNLRVGKNRIRAVFLDPAEQALYPDLEFAMAGVVAGFRASVGTDTKDPGFIQLVGELSLESEDFREIWARHDVQLLEGAATLIRHPVVGDLTLRREKLRLTDGMILVIYHAEKGSETAGLLSLLATATAADEDMPVVERPAREIGL